jgi:hypothetical protein
VYALGYRDRKLKTLITNKGTTLEGAPLVVKRTRVILLDGRPTNEDYNRSTPRPQMMDKFFTWFSKIDVHDHRRQGVLKIEQFWKTKTWWHRLFGSLLGVCVIDAYLAYMLEFAAFGHNVAAGLEPFNDWTSRLAYALIFNEFRAQRPTLRERRQAVEEDIEGEGEEDEEHHILAPLSSHTKYLGVKGARLKCKHCSVNTIQYCVKCSHQNPDGTYFVYACCNPFNGTRGNSQRNCYFNHLKQF